MDAKLSREIIELDHRTCRGCGTMDPIGPPHHIIYRSQGGPDEPWNLITFCMACDHKAHHGEGKGSNRKTARQFVLSVLKKHEDVIGYRWGKAYQMLRRKVA